MALREVLDRKARERGEASVRAETTFHTALDRICVAAVKRAAGSGQTVSAVPGMQINADFSRRAGGVNLTGLKDLADKYPDAWDAAQERYEQENGVQLGLTLFRQRLDLDNELRLVDRMLGRTEVGALCLRMTITPPDHAAAQPPAQDAPSGFQDRFLSTVRALCQETIMDNARKGHGPDQGRPGVVISYLDEAPGLPDMGTVRRMAEENPEDWEAARAAHAETLGAEIYIEMRPAYGRSDPNAGQACVVITWPEPEPDGGPEVP